MTCTGPDIPAVLKVGPLLYKVEIAPELRDQDTKERLWGEISYETRTIRLADGDPQTKYVSLIHELVHAELDVIGLELSESQVQALAYSFYGMLVENPVLFPSWAGIFPSPLPG